MLAEANAAQKYIIENYGNFEHIVQCYEQAERKTGVEVACVRIQKEGASYKAELEGFFMVSVVLNRMEGILFFQE